MSLGFAASRRTRPEWWFAADLGSQPDVAHLSNGTDTGMITHKSYKMPGAFTSVRAIFVNPYTQRHRVTVTADPAGYATGGRIPTPGLTQDGRKSAILLPGDIAEFDIPISGAAGDIIFLNYFVEAGTAVGGSSGDKWPMNAIPNQANEGAAASNGQADWTMFTTRVTTPLFIYAPGPITVLGKPTSTQPRLPIFGLIGDSIMSPWTISGEDVFSQDRTHWGAANRALSGRYGYIDLSRGGESSFDWWSKPYRLNLLKYCTDVFINYGSNDIAAGQSVAQLEQNIDYILKACKAAGCRIWYWTILPRPALSGAQNTVRTTVNSHIRAKSGTFAQIDGYLEMADTVETARDSNAFKTNYSDDTIHPADDALGPMAALITADADAGKYNVYG